MTFDDVRKIALAWPEVEDGTSYGTPALKVRKKLLVRLREDGDRLVMPGVPQDEREMLVESQPKVFYFTDHYRDYPMVLIRLSKAKRATRGAVAAAALAGAGVEEGGGGRIGYRSVRAGKPHRHCEEQATKQSMLPRRRRIASLRSQ